MGSYSRLPIFYVVWREIIGKIYNCTNGGTPG